MSKINKIRLSGTDYDIQDVSATSVVELTQQQYDDLPASAKTDNILYIITDSTVDYVTSAQTQYAITQAVSGKVDTSTYTAYTAATDTAIAGKQDRLVSGTNIKTINNESILGSGNIDIQGGGGKAIEAGRGISITTGATADTVSLNLPISAGTGSDSIIEGSGTTASGNRSHAEGEGTYAFGIRSHAEGYQTIASGLGAHAEGNSTQANAGYSHAEGNSTIANGAYSHAEGNITTARGAYSHAEGFYTTANNQSEHASGQYNVSNSATTTFGDSGNTLFSVGNGTADNARHNAFEIRQNGDIYLTKDGQDVKLQDQLGGGGSSYTAGDGINISNENVISVTGKADTSAVTAIQDSLSGYVTTDTEQIISGRKIFTYSASSSKAIEFKQTDDSAKVGFRVRTSAETNNELASFEFRPNTFTVDSVQHPLLYFGHYRNTNTAAAGVPQTYIGFRQYDQLNAAAYHYLIPLPEKARAPFSLTTSFKDYYAPIGFKNGSTMITADDTGVVDLSSEFSGKADTATTYTKSETNTLLGDKADTATTYTKTEVDTALGGKQDTLVSGTNIKTINNESILGSGNIDIQGGGGSSYTAGDGIDITNNVISVTGKVDTSAITTSVSSSSTDAQVPSAKAVNDKLGGLKLVKLTQSAYDALAPNYDSNTLYVING